MLPGPDKRECPCGCGTFGTPRRRAWADGLTAHVNRCPCRRCVGSRQRGKATRRESRIARDTGGSREPLSGALSGVDGRAGLWVWEETANVAVVRGFKRWIESATVTTKTARLMARSGVRRAFVLSWDGRPRWVVVPYSDWTREAAESVGQS